MGIADCPDSTEALRLARLCIEHGWIIVTDHAKVRLGERGFDYLDIERVLKAGQIFLPPEWDIKYRNWKYRIEGKAIDGEDLALIVCFQCQPSTKIITVF